MRTEHTPTPWLSNEYSTGTYIDGRDGATICFLDVNSRDKGPLAEKRRANAQYIVRCVNSHAALVEALREAVESWRTVNAEENKSSWLNKAEAALDDLSCRVE